MDLLKFTLMVLCSLPIVLGQTQLSPKDKERQEIFKVEFMRCNQDLGITLPPLENLTELINQAREYNAKCWVKCYLEGTGMVDTQGKLKTQGPVDHITNLANQQNDTRTASRAGEIVSVCQTMTPIGNPCLDAPKNMRCLFSNMDRVILSNFFEDVAVSEIRRRYGSEILKRFPSIRAQMMAESQDQGQSN